MQIALKLHNPGHSNHRLCVRFTKTSETEAFSSSKPDSMVLDGGDANAIEMAPTTTLVFRINVQSLRNETSVFCLLSYLFIRDLFLRAISVEGGKMG